MLWMIFRASEWKGLEYFEELFSTSDFRTAVLNTLIISFSRILLTFAVPILVAVLINEIRNTVFRKTVTFTKSGVSPVSDLQLTAAPTAKAAPMIRLSSVGKFGVKTR